MKTASLAVLPVLLLMLAGSPPASAFTMDPPIVVPNEQDLHKAITRKSPAPELVGPPTDWSPTEEELQDLGYRAEPETPVELKETPAAKPGEDGKKPAEGKPGAAPKAGAEAKPGAETKPGAVPAPPNPPAGSAPAAPAPAPQGAPGSSAPTLEPPKLEVPKVPAPPPVQVPGPGGI